MKIPRWNTGHPRAAGCLTLTLLVLMSPAAFAQDAPRAGYGAHTVVVGPQHPERDLPTEDGGPDRSGFTLGLSIGPGYQSFQPVDAASDGGLGLSGVSIGLGGFLTPDLALLFRTMGGVSWLSDTDGNDVTRLSGVAGPALQVWPALALRLEAGVGFAVIRTETDLDERTVSESSSGVGLMLSAGYAFWQSSDHSLQFIVEYAPAFLDSGTAHNLGFVLGWQLL